MLFVYKHIERFEGVLQFYQTQVRLAYCIKYIDIK